MRRDQDDLHDKWKPWHITIGGDHHITYHCVKAAAKRLGHPVRLVTFDAHHDVWDEAKGLTNASWLLYAISDGYVDGVDFRGLRVDDSDLGEVKRWTHKWGATEPFYVTIDIDVLDPAFAPGVTWPVAFGWEPERLLREAQTLVGQEACVGVDIVEFDADQEARITGVLVAGLIDKIAHAMYARGKH